MLWNLIILKYKQWELSHLLLLLVLVLYSFLGALCFVALERPNEIDKRAKLINDSSARSRSAKYKLFTQIRDFRRNYSQVFSKETFSKLRNIISRYDKSMRFDMDEEKPLKWTLLGGLYYAGTIYTTIGYGDLTTETRGGKVLSMLYAVIGIPLVLTILNDWGSLLFRLVHGLWFTHIDPLCNRIYSLFSSWHAAHLTTSDNSTVGHLRETDREEAIPLVVACILLALWVLLCACVFCVFEEWSLFDSVYFFFVSLTTIGFGDVTPRHGVAVANFLLILLGLSVVSMAINIIQMQLELLFERIVSTINDDFKEKLIDEMAEKKRKESRAHQETATNKDDFMMDVERNAKGAERLLMQFMSQHDKKLLNEKYSDKMKMRNRSTQTSTLVVSDEVQTEVMEELDDLDSSQLSQPCPRDPAQSRFYIYNTGE